METLKTLPDLQGRKFGSLAFGYDRIEQMRMEFGILEALAALLLNIPREEVTIPLVQRLIADLGNRMMSINEEDLTKIEGIDATTLLALALAKRAP